MTSTAAVPDLGTTFYLSSDRILNLGGSTPDVVLASNINDGPNAEIKLGTTDVIVVDMVLSLVSSIIVLF